MNRYIKFVFILAVFSIAFLGMAGDLHAAKLSDYGLKEGDLVSALFSDDPDVYIINEQGYKRLFLNAEIFNFYGHLGGFFNVKLVSEEVLDAFPTSGLFRNCEDNDPRVYGVEIESEDIGKLRWLNASATSTLSEDPNFFKKVFCVNKKEFNWYPKGLHLKFLKDLPKYERKLAKKIEKAVRKEMKDHKDDSKYFEKNIKGVGKIVICHKGLETITIGLPAMQAHIKHGDEIGKCGAPTPTPGDTTAPVISGASATSTTYNSTHIVWITNENANGKVRYSTSTPVVATSSIPSVSSTALITSHDMTLTGLSASTTYYYLVQSSDASGNVGTSTEQSFTTLSAPDTTAPVISGISATSTASTTTSIVWTTNEPADSTVWYAISTPVSTATASSTSSASLTTSHNISLSGLNASTLYYYFVGSKDSALNAATSTEYSFTTLAP